MPHYAPKPKHFAVVEMTPPRSEKKTELDI